MILLIDNYDSFAHNLARYFRLLGQETRVVRNDVIDVDSLAPTTPDAIVISPGPCTPKEAGKSLEIVRRYCDKLPMLGICLGHQVIAAALGAEIIRAQTPMHGRTSSIDHQKSALFAGLPSPLEVCRYHSLVVDPTSLPESLEVSATSSDDTIMALQHRNSPVYGLQFHPEAILTQHGFQLLGNFLKLAGLNPPENISELTAAEQSHSQDAPPPLPQQPVTF